MFSSKARNAINVVRAAANDLVEAVEWFGHFKKINSENLAPECLLMRNPFGRTHIWECFDGPGMMAQLVGHLQNWLLLFVEDVISANDH